MTTPTYYRRFHLNVVDAEGNPIESGVSYTVLTNGTATAATIYGDAVGTAKTNPVTTTVFATDKQVVFWGTAAIYDVMLELANGQRARVNNLTPSSEHKVVLFDQELAQKVCVSDEQEFDCGLASAAAAVVLIPAAANPNGLIITSIIGRVTEVFAGGTQDQGVVTVSDESDNSLGTLTPSDAGADALNDLIEGYLLHEGSTGDALKVVAAGEYVDAVVTQLTSGTGLAGKMKVYVTYIRL